jgi:hypothetical protein
VGETVHKPPLAAPILETERHAGVPPAACRAQWWVRQCLRQLGGLRVLRGVEEGVAEEARTRSFAAPAFAGCAFVARVCDASWDDSAPAIQSSLVGRSGRAMLLLGADVVKRPARLAHFVLDSPGRPRRFDAGSPPPIQKSLPSSQSLERPSARARGVESCPLLCSRTNSSWQFPPARQT